MNKKITAFEVGVILQTILHSDNYDLEPIMEIGYDGIEMLADYLMDQGSESYLHITGGNEDE